MVTSNIEKLLHVFQAGGESVIRQAVEEHLPVALPGDTVVQQNQHAAVALGTDQPPETLLQGDGGLRNLVIVKGTSPRFLDALGAGVHHRRSEERRVGK